MIDVYLKFIRNKIIRIFKLDASSLRVPMTIASIFALNFFCLATLIYRLNGYSVFGGLFIFIIMTMYVIVKSKSQDYNMIPRYNKRLDLLFKTHLVITFTLFLLVVFITS
jgi:hypothetical protein